MMLDAAHLAAGQQQGKGCRSVVPQYTELVMPVLDCGSVAQVCEVR